MSLASKKMSAVEKHSTGSPRVVVVAATGGSPAMATLSCIGMVLDKDASLSSVGSARVTSSTNGTLSLSSHCPGVEKVCTTHASIPVGSGVSSGGGGVATDES